MKQPAATRHNPDENYLKGLFEELRALGRTRISICQQIGVPYRTMSDYLNPDCGTKMDYCTQYAVETILNWELESLTIDQERKNETTRWPPRRG